MTKISLLTNGDRMSGYKRILSKLLLGMLSIIGGQIPSISNTNSEKKSSDKELIVALSSENSEEATKALEGIYKAGDRMIPLLVSCQGNRSLYWGYNLGHKNSHNELFFPDKQGEAATHVTIEITSLYLLEAIFRKDLEFADSPFLYDHTKSHKQPRNADVAIHRAWNSIDWWFSLLNKKGIEYLRKKQINPLFKSKTSFWGSL